MNTKMGIPVMSVDLYVKTQSGVDAFNRPVYTETKTTIDDVVVGSPTSDDIVSSQTLSDKTIAYVLAIPRGDTNTWENAVVEFYGRKWRVVGIPTEYIDGFMGADYPWNKKVKVEAYE